MATDTDRMSDGAEAEHILARLKPHFAKQRAATITRMIAHYNTESLTDGTMRALVATLAAIDALEKDLSHRVRLGQKDMYEAMTAKDVHDALIRRGDGHG
jgi:hypothetical protein